MKRLIKSFLDKMPYIIDLRQLVEKQGEFPAGHYYSPVPDKDEVLRYIKSIKPLKMELLDIKLNEKGQFSLLKEYVQFYEDLPLIA